MSADANEAAFQQDIIDEMVGGGWKLGDPASYNRDLALYTSDCVEYVKTTQPKTWEKYTKLYPSNPEQAFIDTRGREVEGDLDPVKRCLGLACEAVVARQILSEKVCHVLGRVRVTRLDQYGGRLRDLPRLVHASEREQAEGAD